MLMLDLVDTNLRLGKDGEISYSEPGIALVEPKNLTFGSDALAKIKLQPDQEQSQYWQKMDQSPVHPSGFAVETQADLVYRQLVSICEESQLQSEEPVWVVVPGNLSNSQIALLYGIAMQTQLRIADFVDRGVAAASSVDVHGSCVFVDLGLHRTIVTQLSVEDVVQKTRVSVLSRLGWLPLFNAWIRHVTNRFLDSARFDPRKFANTEQQVFDQLIDFVTGVDDACVLHVEHLGNVRQVELTRAELASAAHEHYRAVLTYIDQGCPVLLLEDSAKLPGFVGFLNVEGSTCFERSFSDLYEAVNRLESSDSKTDSRTLHVEIPHVKSHRSSVSQGPVVSLAPTHLVRKSIAYPIGSSFSRHDLGEASLGFEINKNSQGLTVAPIDGAALEVNGRRIDRETAVKTGDSIVASSGKFEIIAEWTDG